jgi:hypothetical protein
MPIDFEFEDEVAIEEVPSEKLSPEDLMDLNPTIEEKQEILGETTIIDDEGFDDEENALLDSIELKPSEVNDSIEDEEDSEILF